MAMTDFFTHEEPHECKQRLLVGGRPGYLVVGSDGTNDLAAWSPSSDGGLTGGVYCRIALRGAEEGTRITVRTCASSLVRSGVMCWSLFGGWIAFRFGLFPILHDGNASFDRLVFPLCYAFMIAVMVMARVSDGRSLEERVLATIRRELKVRAAAAEPDRASSGR
jgi:hypothetical protein